MDVPAEEAHSENDATIRLSLSDLFVWMTLTAMLCFVSQLSFYQYFHTDLEETLSQISLLTILPVGMTSLYLFARRLWRRQPFDFQPGHWLLVQYGVVGVGYVVSVVVTYLTNPPFDEAFIARESNWVNLVLFLNQCAYLTIALWAAFYFPVRSPWRISLIFPVIGRVFYLGNFVLYFLRLDTYRLGGTDLILRSMSFTFLELPVLIGLAIWDARTAPSRD